MLCLDTSPSHCSLSRGPLETKCRSDPVNIYGCCLFHKGKEGAIAMNAGDVLEQSHTLLTQAVDDLPEAAWDVPGVCGEWSVKDIVAHLASYERLLIDILQALRGDEITPYVRLFLNDGETFNRVAVESRKYQTAQQVLNEYEEAQLQTTALLAQIPAQKIEQPGTMPWWNQEICLADEINSLCAHTQQHTDQIIQFRKRAGSEFSG